MAAKKSTTQHEPAATQQKREPDIFTAARRIYSKRAELLAEHARLLEEADPRVRRMVDSLEEVEASAQHDAAEGPDSE